jgi:hypothetical protein
MRDLFVRTSNVMRGWAALGELWEGRAASQQNLCLVDGKTGYGKTEFLEDQAEDGERKLWQQIIFVLKQAWRQEA